VWLVVNGGSRTLVPGVGRSARGRGVGGEGGGGEGGGKIAGRDSVCAVSSPICGRRFAPQRHSQNWSMFHENANLMACADSQEPQPNVLLIVLRAGSLELIHAR